MELLGIMFALALIAGSIALYGLPSIIAYSRHAQRRDAICILNLLLGWTLLGWIGTLIWACTDEVVLKED